jgi:uncharacterized protein YbjT (DUF2867 family)
MARILVAGGTGAVGTAVVRTLQSTDHIVRVLSRRPAPPTRDRRTEWAQGDTSSGAGLAEALADVDVLVNCTGDARNAYDIDVLGVKRLADAAQQAKIGHFFHISIVGIDRLTFEYFRHKVSAEAAVRESGVPYSIQRVTQFHTLLDGIMQAATLTPDGCLLPVDRAALFQLIDTSDVADYILPLVLAAPAGMLKDVGGPHVLRVDEIAETYLRLRGLVHARLFDPPSDMFPPAAVEELRQGLATVPGHRYGRITWADYVTRQYGASSTHAGRQA